MTTSEFNILKENVYKQYQITLEKKPYLTQGQIIYNILKEEFPGIVGRIKAKQIDPTEDDNNLIEFWNILEKKLIV